METLQTLTRTHIYGTGVKDILAQAEIKGGFDTYTGKLKITLDKDKCLVVSCDGGALKFQLESAKSPLEYSY